jgi:hypothetical protein
MAKQARQGRAPSLAPYLDAGGAWFWPLSDLAATSVQRGLAVPVQYLLEDMDP